MPRPPKLDASENAVTQERSVGPCLEAPHVHQAIDLSRIGVLLLYPGGLPTRWPLALAARLGRQDGDPGDVAQLGYLQQPH